LKLQLLKNSETKLCPTFFQISPEAEYFQNFEFKPETFVLKAKHKQLEHKSQG
jgi:hypothetical protein